MSEQHFADQMAAAISQDSTLDENSKNIVLRNLAKLKDTKVNILITGPTGCGKSSTINALFDAEKAKVGQSPNPETMDIAKYELNNIILFDSPGLGDGKEADIRHAKGITDKLLELDKNGEPLIDLVLVILDAGSKDMGTSYELIEQVIIPSLGKDTSRLLVALNQADMGMKGRYWDYKENKPEPRLVNFLEEKLTSVRQRIKKNTGVDIEPIYYAAGYKEGDEKQNPYNLSKLLLHILRHTKSEKRAVFVQDVNKNSEMWKDDDRLEDYRNEAKKSMFESIKEYASAGADIGGAVGRALGGGVLETVGRAIGGLAGGAWAVLTSWW